MLSSSTYWEKSDNRKRPITTDEMSPKNKLNDRIKMGNGDQN